MTRRAPPYANESPARAPTVTVARPGRALAVPASAALVHSLWGTGL
ncbi:hypothetical protein [Streptomyces sp. NPDC093544]